MTIDEARGYHIEWLENRNAELLLALTRLSNEVLGTLPLMETLCRHEFGNTNYAILIQRAEEARAIITKLGKAAA